MKKYRCKICGYIHEGDTPPDICPVCKAPASEFEEIKTENRKRFNREGNVYTILYASVIVVLVAVMLAVTAQVLGERQKRNESTDKKRQILASLNISSTNKTAEDLYNEYITASYLVDVQGQKTEGDAFFTKLDAVLRLPEAEQCYPVFEATVGGQKKYVLSMRGSGLWGPLWGFISFDDDRNTVYGASFGHESETPGLGAEIESAEFSNKFKGKHFFDTSGKFVSVAIVKTGKTVQGQDYVDGISGGTITSQGVDVMLKNGIGAYENFLKTNN
ncbi:MAG: NADH:ubiquinone reductase (Na(+)-transporting) subunit C [Dysgonamonadaceae bacterium]|jgi:Na+-transporting NADH:ubiquinone oxidoreductase subunit C|nr:NADH:ubiquinone reductase (Na(+)-transporting) subunit C [Dysgonamonadaceae bacterium]